MAVFGMVNHLTLLEDVLLESLVKFLSRHEPAMGLLTQFLKNNSNYTTKAALALELDDEPATEGNRTCQGVWIP